VSNFISYVYVLASLRSIAQAGNFNAISILNTHATWKANGSRIPPDMDTAFNTFVNELGLNRDKSLTDGTTSLSKAYYAFWAARKRHKE
jgi:hypothetical protein